MIMNRDVFVYLAGPLSATRERTVEENTAIAVKTFMILLQEGIPAFCPHLTAAHPSAWTLFSYDVWLAYDIAVLDRCTHVLMLPGWRDSTGAQREYDHAYGTHKPIAYDLDDLRKQLGHKR